MSKTALEKRGGWKQTRIRPEWIERLRAAHKSNPDFSPNVNLATMKEPKLIELACQIAASHISGWIWEQVDKDVQRIIQAERRDAILTTALHLGGQVEPHADGTITVIAPRKVKPKTTLPAESLKVTRPTLFN